MTGTARRDEQREQKSVLLDQAKDFGLLAFVDIGTAGANAIRELDQAPEVPLRTPRASTQR